VKPERTSSGEEGGAVGKTWRIIVELPLWDIGYETASRMWCERAYLSRYGLARGILVPDDVLIYVLKTTSITLSGPASCCPIAAKILEGAKAFLANHK